MKGRFSLLMAAVAALVSSGGAMAQMSYDPVGQKPKERSPVYIGAGFVSANSKIPQSSLQGISDILGPALGSTFTTINEDQRTNGAKFFIGYRFNKFLAVEAGVVHFGEPGAGYQFNAGGVGIGEASVSYAMGAVFADAVGTWYLTDKFALLGRVGAAVGQTRVDYNGIPLTLISSLNDRTERSTKVKFGLGLQYDFNDAFRIRGEWERYNMPDPNSDDKVKLDAFSASLLYQF